GFMWFGTFDGLNRYDGYTIKTYKPKPEDSTSLSSIIVYSLTGDQEGNLWIGTTGGGLNFYDSETEHFTNFRATPGAAHGLISDNIKCLLLDRQQRLWVGMHQGLNVVDLKTWEPGTSPRFLRVTSGNDSSFHVSEIYEDREGTIWFGSDAGVHYLSPRAPLTPATLKRLPIAGFNPVNSIQELPSGDLVFGGRGGTYVHPAGTDSVRLITEITTTSLGLDSTRNWLWVGTYGGLQRHRILADGTTRLVANYVNDPTNRNSLSNNSIEELHMGADSSVWIGTFGGGVNLYDARSKDFGHLAFRNDADGLSNNNVRSIAQDAAGRVWIGTVGGGTDVALGPLLRTEEPSFRRLPLPSTVYAFMEVVDAEQHYMYLGTDVTPNLYRVNLKDPAWPVEPVTGCSHSVFSMFRDSRGYLWFGTYWGGVFRWIPDPTAPGGYRIKQFLDAAKGRAAAINIVRAITEDSLGNIWIGTGAGLVRISAPAIGSDAPHFTTFRHQPREANSLSHDYVLSLRPAPDGSLWVGTFGGGLNRLTFPAGDSEPVFRHYSGPDGLPNDVVKAILVDEHQLVWATTNKGIVRLNPATDDVMVIDQEDGLHSNEFQELAALRQTDGQLVFGNVKGVNYFFPEEAHQDRTKVHPILTHLEILNVPVTYGTKINDRVILPKPLHRTDNIRLRYNENSLSLEFSALQYLSPEDNQYAYMLE
ncbi:MAG: two-component regulator propeller domain-containing protein, partial [Bacteroidota bacterium]